MDFENMTALIPVYKCTERTLAEIRNLFPPERPWIIPAQSMDILHMPAPTNLRQYYNRVEKPLNNVTEMMPVFFKDSR